MPQMRVLAIPLESLDSAALLGTYQPINTGLPNACFRLRVINGGTTAIVISYDGSEDHDVVFANSILEVPTSIVTSMNQQGALFAKGLVVYAKGTAGVGTIAVAGYYQRNP